MEKKFVPFNKSMTLDKRNPDSAYLRNNLLDIDGRGMYPSVDFSTVSGVPINGVVKQFVGGRVFVQNGPNVEIYMWHGSGSLGTVDFTVAGVNFVNAVDGNDGVHWITNRGDVYRNGTKISTSSYSRGTKIIFDGLYYFMFARRGATDIIYRQLRRNIETVVFGDTGTRVEHAFAFDDRIFFITRDGLDFTISIWGKDSATLIDRRTIVHNARPLACGVISGVPIFVTSVGNRTNIKELNGEIVISSFNGQDLERLNRIKSGDAQLNTEHNGYAVGNGIMLVGLKWNDNNDNADLYHNFVLKIKKDGSIETIFDVSLTRNADIECVSVEYDYLTVALENGTFYNNIDSQSGYSRYFNYIKNSTYITPLLDFTTTKHKFGGVGVSFEKMFENSSNAEELTISYRVSERDSWTVIDTITSQMIIDNMEMRQDQTVKDAEKADDNVGVNVQMYEITKMPDGTPFNEYYEIQFKLESRRGFSVIDFWYYTDAIKRITRG